MPQSLPEGKTQINAHLPAGLARRVKRHVVAAIHGFFAATAPGLEAVCRDELMAAGLAHSPQVVPGGVEFSGRLDVCYGSNLRLRTANRILMRIAEFKATGFGSLDKKASGIPWELFLPPGQDLDIRVSAKNSRLMHTGAISERIMKAISARLGRSPEPSLPGKVCQRLYVRTVKDLFTLSIDTSGESLYKRGVKTHGGRAPLRETAAAAILMLAGYRPGMPLLDPMCGSGSFSIEAAMMSRLIPPGWFRRFAFMDWPSYRPRQWAHLRKEVLSEASLQADITAPIVASDRDLAVCRRLSQTLEKWDLSGSVQLVNADFLHMPLHLTDATSPHRTGLVVLNPPYGKRIGSRKESWRLMPAICDTLMSDFKGWRFALLAPPQSMPSGFPRHCHTRQIFHNGGLKLMLVTGQVG
jgi:putative N6-adenine-specific DNA methylase